jgi:CubicO group peptidase (beta-lactamase class C family)
MCHDFFMSRVPRWELLILLVILPTHATEFSWTPPSTNKMQTLNDFLTSFRQKFEYPALAASVISGTNIIYAGAVGVRKAGDKTPVELTDKFHIGSCTKSMTALLGVILDREGSLHLEDKTVRVFPEWKLKEPRDQIDLKILLRNHSGLGNTPPKKLWAGAFNATGQPAEQRATFLKKFLKEPLEAKPGEKYFYSNFGFALAGAMMEKETGKSWENMAREKIFLPLGMLSAGFGPPAHDNLIDQPWGHQKVNGKFEPIPPSDNPVAIAPAGAVHCSILDLARYAAFHLQAARGNISELKPYLGFLYSPVPGSNYAAGWIVEERDWAGGKVITHSGSNTMFYTVIWIVPVKNFAFVVSTNVGEKDSNSIPMECDEVISGLIHKNIQ